MFDCFDCAGVRVFSQPILGDQLRGVEEPVVVAPLRVSGLAGLADALVGVGEDEANVEIGMFRHDVLVLLPISSDEPTLGLNDDTVGEDVVRAVRPRLEWGRVPDLRCFVVDRDQQGAELIRNLVFKSTTVSFNQPALIRSLLRRHLLLRRSLP